jgi:hypothetical protein
MKIFNILQILTGTALLFVNSARADYETKDYVDAFEKRACTRHVVEPAKRAEFLLQKYFINTKSENQIPANFAYLEQLSADFLKSVSEIADRYKNANITSQDEYNTTLKAFEKEMSNLEKVNLAQLNFKQRLFSASLNSVEADIRDLRVQVSSIEQMNCTDKAKQNINGIRDLSSKMENQSAKFRLLTDQKIRAMGEITGTLKSSLRANLVSSFAKNVGKSFDELISTVNSAFAMFDLSDEVYIWYQEAFVFKGASRGLWSKYLLYTQALDQVDKDIAFGNEFYKKLDALSLPKDQYDIQKYQIDLKIKALETGKAEIIRKGFADRISMHQRVVGNMELKKRWTSSFCDDEFTKYKKEVSNLAAKNDLTTFSNSETNLKYFLSTCVHKE